jgi:hypothetical protein
MFELQETLVILKTSYFKFNNYNCLSQISNRLKTKKASQKESSSSVLYKPPAKAGNTTVANIYFCLLTIKKQIDLIKFL